MELSTCPSWPTQTHTHTHTSFQISVSQTAEANITHLCIFIWFRWWTADCLVFISAESEERLYLNTLMQKLPCYQIRGLDCQDIWQPASDPRTLYAFADKIMHKLDFVALFP